LGQWLKKNKLYYVSPNTRIQILPNDQSPIASIHYIIDKRSYKTTGIIDLTKFSGYKQLCFYAKDVAGNTSYSQCINLFVDSKPPVSHLKFSGPKLWDRDTLFITSNTEIAIVANDAQVGVQASEYAINNLDFTQYTQPFKILNDGVNVIYYRSRDKVGNLEKTKQKLV
jgi:hypothetical protein